MSVCLSLHVGRLGSHRTDFDEIWYLSVTWKSVKKIKVSLKCSKTNGYFTWKHFHIYDNVLLNSSYNEKCFKVVEKIKTHTLNNIFWKSCHLWGNMKKCGGTKKATDNSVIWHMCFPCLTTKAVDTFRICNSYCFFAATKVLQTCLIVMLHIHCLLFLCLVSHSTVMCSIKSQRF
jgi:hypothetical protein